MISDLLDGPPRHLERLTPPWSSHRSTICGRPLSTVAAWMTYDEGRQLITQLGQTRACLLLCQTCAGQETRIARPELWQQDPAAVVHDYTRHLAAPPHSAGAQQIRAELLALAQLVDAHPDQYQAAVAAHLTDELSAKRRARR